MTRHVAIVGSGPAGFYCAEALCKKDPEIRIDILDRLPTPYGLVRTGVAPDQAVCLGAAIHASLLAARRARAAAV